MFLWLLAGASQAQPDGSFHCAEAVTDYDPSLHDVKQATVRQLLGNLPRERHEPAPICVVQVNVVRHSTRNEVPPKVLSVLGVSVHHRQAGADEVSRWVSRLPQAGALAAVTAWHPQPPDRTAERLAGCMTWLCLAVLLFWLACVEPFLVSVLFSSACSSRPAQILVNQADGHDH